MALAFGSGAVPVTLFALPATLTWLGTGMWSAAAVKGRKNKLGVTLLGPIVGIWYIGKTAVQKISEECGLCCKEMREPCCPETVVAVAPKVQG